MNNNEIEMAQRAVEAAQARLDRALAVTVKYGDGSQYEDGDVIYFDKQFFTSSKTYRYAAIRFNGLWYTTGPKSPKAYTWAQLVHFFTDGPEVEQVWLATEWTEQ